jgi:hypothetical protein
MNDKSLVEQSDVSLDASSPALIVSALDSRIKCAVGATRLSRRVQLANLCWHNTHGSGTRSVLPEDISDIPNGAKAHQECLDLSK